MDIRLFKLLILTVGETVIFLVSFLLSYSRSYLPVHPAIVDAIRLGMIALPILLLLPEENWIWLVEENPRSRKISLRSKSIKHLHLSMLYILLFFTPPMILCVSLMRVSDFYSFQLTGHFMVFAALYGVFCAWKNYVNVREYESLFAVAWDRRSVFIEIFVGFKVSRRPYFFYSGFALLCGIFMVLGSFLIPLAYFRHVSPPHAYFDVQKYIVMSMVFHFFLVLGVWGTTMYIVFQTFFSRNLERWANKSKDRKK